jgi:hypothetical protein
LTLPGGGHEERRRRSLVVRTAEETGQRLRRP